MDPLVPEIFPYYEYLLQGSILDSAVETLLCKLKSMCDNVDLDPEPFHDHEICFRMSSSDGLHPPLLLRVRRALDVDAPYQLRYTGQLELANRPTIVRSSIDVGCTSNVIEYLTELGFEIEFQYICRGFMFRKGNMKVTVSKIMKITTVPDKPEEIINEPLTQSYLVELSALAPADQVALCKEMLAFAEDLKPLITLEKLS